MSGLVRSLIRPYRTWVLIVFAAMMVETLMSLAAPWPLKVVLDNALGHDKLPEWLAWLEERRAAMATHEPANAGHAHPGHSVHTHAH